MINTLKNSWLASLLFPLPDQMWGTQADTLCDIISECRKQGMMALEIGSWCGHSSSIIGAVVKECAGRLVCVDWWKGADDRQTKVSRLHDVYGMFWRRMVKAGLADTVIPMRGKSGDVLPLLADKQFDLIFVDGDHRYDGIKADIKQVKRLIKPRGTICGHDCECKPTPELMPFLNQNKNTDYTDEFHCGVILAVAEEFKEYELDNGFWIA